MDNEQKTVYMKCSNPKCDSNEVQLILNSGGSDRLYRCVKCGAIKSVSVGGYFPY